MHPLRRHLQGSTLLVALFAAISGSATAQGTSPASSPIDPTPPGDTITVFEGQSNLYTAKGKVIGFLISDPRICTIGTAETSPFTHFTVNGLKRGASQITLSLNPPSGSSDPPGAKSYCVVVVPDPNARKAELDQLAVFIQSQFPAVVGLRIEGVPGSPKVVVSGTAPDQWVAMKIIEMVASEKIPAKEVINKLMVACPPPPPPAQSCCQLPYAHVHGR
jgi:hypothetical protein